MYAALSAERTSHHELLSLQRKGSMQARENILCLPQSCHHPIDAHRGRWASRTWSYIPLSLLPTQNQLCSPYKKDNIPLLLPLSPLRRFLLFRISLERNTLYSSHKVTQLGACSPDVAPRSNNDLCVVPTGALCHVLRTAHC